MTTARSPLETYRRFTSLLVNGQFGELPDVVAHHSLHADVAADRIEMFGDEQGIGVDAKGRQHLGADGDDTGSHLFIWSSDYLVI